MSDSDQRPAQDSKPKKDSKGGQSRKPESPNSNSTVLYLLIVATIFLVFSPLLFTKSQVKTLTLSEFETGLANNTFNKTNVHNLMIGRTAITFQDQPLPEPEGAVPEVEPKGFRIPIATIGDTWQAQIKEEIKSHGISVSPAEAPSDWQSWALLMIIAAPLILLLILMIRRVGGAGSALSFGRSRGKVYAQDDLDTTFDDVKGIDEAVEELKEVVEFLK